MDRRVVSSIILGLAAFGVVFQAISFLTPGWVCIESGDDAPSRVSQRRQQTSGALTGTTAQRQNDSAVLTNDRDDQTRRPRRRNGTRADYTDDNSRPSKGNDQRNDTVINKPGKKNRPGKGGGKAGGKTDGKAGGKEGDRPKAGGNGGKAGGKGSKPGGKGRNNGSKRDQRKKTRKTLASALGGGLSTSSWSIKIGLLYTWQCQQIAGAEDAACDYGNDKSLQLLKMASKQELDLSTWRGLRVSAALGMTAGVVGLVAAILALKTSYFRSRTSILVMAAFGGMLLSGILFMVPVAMLGNVNTMVSGHLDAFSKIAILKAPWSIVIGGIGACATIVASAAVAMFSWNDIKNKFKRFEDEVSFARKDEISSAKSVSVKEGLEMDSGYTDIKGVYDNLGAIEGSKA